MNPKTKRGRRTAASNLTTQRGFQQQDPGSRSEAQSLKPRLMDLVPPPKDDYQNIQRWLAPEIRALIVSLAVIYGDKAARRHRNAIFREMSWHVRPGMLPRQLVRLAAAVARLRRHVADGNDVAALTEYVARSTDRAFYAAPLLGPRFYEIMQAIVEGDTERVLRAAKPDESLAR